MDMEHVSEDMFTLRVIVGTYTHSDVQKNELSHINFPPYLVNHMVMSKYFHTDALNASECIL